MGRPTYDLPLCRLTVNSHCPTVWLKLVIEIKANIRTSLQATSQVQINYRLRPAGFELGSSEYKLYVLTTATGGPVDKHLTCFHVILQRTTRMISYVHLLFLKRLIIFNWKFWKKTFYPYLRGDAIWTSKHYYSELLQFKTWGWAHNWCDHIGLFWKGLGDECPNKSSPNIWTLLGLFR